MRLVPYRRRASRCRCDNPPSQYADGQHIKPRHTGQQTATHLARGHGMACTGARHAGWGGRRLGLGLVGEGAAARLAGAQHARQQYIEGH